MPGSRRAKAPDEKHAPAGAAEIRRAGALADALIPAYPDARCMLDHRSPFELLVATILAAQCTDERVNLTTPALFRRFPTPERMAEAEMEELEELVRSTGFFHNKAKLIKGAATALAGGFPGGCPETMDELLTIPGVGRKTANVVRGTCFGAPALIVDTHMRRVAQRLGLSGSDAPDQIERDLAALLPPARWTAFSHAMTFHGRRCCTARKPDHEGCPVRGLCPSAEGE